jgi:GNAT superfamily N-acetyltransferase
MLVRRAGVDDIPALASLTEQWMVDEGHDSPLPGDAVAARLRGWLASDSHAALGMNDAEPALCPLWRPDENTVYLRQCFVARPHRRHGLGTALLRALREEFGPPATWVRLDVLVTHPGGRAF